MINLEESVEIQDLLEVKHNNSMDVMAKQLLCYHVAW